METQKILTIFSERIIPLFDIKEIFKIKSYLDKDYNKEMCEISYIDTDEQLVILYSRFNENEEFCLEDEYGNSYIEELRNYHYKDEDFIHYLKTGETSFYEINKTLGIKIYCKKKDDKTYYKVNFCDSKGDKFLSFKPNSKDKQNKIDDLWYFLSSIGSKQEFIDYLSCFGKVQEVEKISDAPVVYSFNGFLLSFVPDEQEIINRGF